MLLTALTYPRLELHLSFKSLDGTTKYKPRSPYFRNNGVRVTVGHIKSSFPF